MLYDHLKVFGCKIFVHVPKDKRSKLDAKTHKCNFLGYGLDDFGDRLYDPTAKKIVRSQDIIFFKDQAIEDISKAVKIPKSHHDNVGDLDLTSPSTFKIQAKYDGIDDASNIDNTDNLDSSIDDAETIPMEVHL